ncbi:MAG: hypothetical protein C4583_02415 [Anaerolineaceae bacterium]|nr:MAG: hypothetical protein C4583_02415 [Anaerolineaceae bacterium]
MTTKKLLIVLGTLLLAATLLAACGGEKTEAPVVPTEEPAPTFSTDSIPYYNAWVNSGHNDVAGEPFRHWDGDDPAEVPTSCARCHSTAGYQDFLGADGSEANKVDAAVPAADAQGIQCMACHNPVASTLDSVAFPGFETDEAGEPVPFVVEGFGDATRCLVCHQGRESKASVDAQIARFQITDVDAVVAPIKDDQGNDVRFGFRNIHYFAAAATLYGTQVKGGYEYEGNIYDARHMHVEGYDTCIGCHDPHTLEVKVEQCATCHGEGVTAEGGLKDIREPEASAWDYDGDGDVEEGMYYEIEGLQAALLAEIKTYAKDKAGTGITYDPATYPYFLTDADGDGAADTNAEGGVVGYSTWTARLLKAAYNYQVSLKDPGAFAHGNKYIVQLLYDSIKDLGGDVSKFVRDDAGHFAGNTEAFRHWDGDEYTVPAGCAKCHSAGGMAEFIKEGAVVSKPASNGFLCSTCHDEANWPERYAVTTVPFPSGASITFSKPDADGKLVPDDANLCLECHQGRESTTSVNRALANKEPDTVDAKIRFLNVHYFAAGATLFGTDAKGAYEFEGKTYLGKHGHIENGFTCKSCHDVHELEVKTEACATCHGTEDLEAIRYGDPVDYDGDGDTAEGIAGEIATLQEALYATMQSYAESHGGALEYKAASYPYFFGADGKGYATWTPNLMKAAYNYQYSLKDPGAFAHNAKYVIQFLIDSIEALGGDVTTYTRP